MPDQTNAEIAQEVLQSLGSSNIDRLFALDRITLAQAEMLLDPAQYEIGNSKDRAMARLDMDEFKRRGTYKPTRDYSESTPLDRILRALLNYAVDTYPVMECEITRESNKPLITPSTYITPVTYTSRTPAEARYAITMPWATIETREITHYTVPTVHVHDFARTVREIAPTIAELHPDTIGRVVAAWAPPKGPEAHEPQAPQESPTTSDVKPLAHVLGIEKPQDLTIKISLSELKQKPVTVCGPTGKIRSLSWKENFRYRGDNKRKKILLALALNHGAFEYREGDDRAEISRYINELNEDIRQVLGIANSNMRFVKCEYGKGVKAICKIEQSPD